MWVKHGKLRGGAELVCPAMNVERATALLPMSDRRPLAAILAAAFALEGDVPVDINRFLALLGPPQGRCR